MSIRIFVVPSPLPVSLLLFSTVFSHHHLSVSLPPSIFLSLSVPIHVLYVLHTRIPTYTYTPLQQTHSTPRRNPTLECDQNEIICCPSSQHKHTRTQTQVSNTHTHVRTAICIFFVTVCPRGLGLCEYKFQHFLQTRAYTHAQTSARTRTV